MKLAVAVANRVLPSYSVATSAVILATGSLSDELVIWALRGFVSLCIMLIAYFIKKMVDDSQKANTERDRRLASLEKENIHMVKFTAAHEVMYGLWLENIANEPHPKNGTRRTDQLHRIIERIAEEKKA